MKTSKLALLIYACLVCAFAPLRLTAQPVSGLPSATPPKDGVLKQLNTQLKTADAETARRGDAEIIPIVQNFRAGEFQLEAFGTARSSSLASASLDYSAGVGANYFITRGLGIGGRVYADDTQDKFVDAIEPRVTLRAPLWDRVAPYAYLNGRFDTARNSWSAGSGGGIETRLAPSLGVFVEAGFQVETSGKGAPEACAGIRLAL